jgi:hypothetical protein
VILNSQGLIEEIQLLKSYFVRDNGADSIIIPANNTK